MTKLSFISDTHSFHRDIIVPPTDVLIHCGDFMSGGYEGAELLDFVHWMKE